MATAATGTRGKFPAEERGSQLRVEKNWVWVLKALHGPSVEQDGCTSSLVPSSKVVFLVYECVSVTLY